MVIIYLLFAYYFFPPIKKNISLVFFFKQTYLWPLSFQYKMFFNQTKNKNFHFKLIQCAHFYLFNNSLI